MICTSNYQMQFLSRNMGSSFSLHRQTEQKRKQNIFWCMQQHYLHKKEKNLQKSHNLCPYWRQSAGIIMYSWEKIQVFNRTAVFIKPHVQFWKKKPHNFILGKPIIIIKKRQYKKFRATFFQKLKPNSFSLSILELYTTISFIQVLELN